MQRTTIVSMWASSSAGVIVEVDVHAVGAAAGGAASGEASGGCAASGSPTTLFASAAPLPSPSEPQPIAAAPAAAPSPPTKVRRVILIGATLSAPAPCRHA